MSQYKQKFQQYFYTVKLMKSSPNNTHRKSSKCIDHFLISLSWMIVHIINQDLNKLLIKFLLVSRNFNLNSLILELCLFMLRNKLWLVIIVLMVIVIVVLEGGEFLSSQEKNKSHLWYLKIIKHSNHKVVKNQKCLSILTIVLKFSREDMTKYHVKKCQEIHIYQTLHQSNNQPNNQSNSPHNLL